MTPDQIRQSLAPCGLKVAAIVDAPLPAPLDDAAQVLLLSPDENFWGIFTSAAEYNDGARHPLDRWSRRVIERCAADLGAAAAYPFEGPPYVPFIQLALASNQIWTSPVGMLVHETDGLFTSFRGALVLSEALVWPHETHLAPCTTCAAPCLGACPVNALSADGYDVPRCAAHLSSPAGASCLSGGCLARRACPVGAGLRPLAQNAFHMAAFYRNHA